MIFPPKIRLRSLLLVLPICAAVAHSPLAQGETKTASGTVFEDRNQNGRLDAGEPAIPNVAVSNGVDVTLTSENGTYTLPVTDDTIVFVVKPTGYRTQLTDDMLPRFHYIHKPAGSPKLKYAGVDPTGDLPASIDFPLYKQEEPDEFEVVYFGDPQPRDQKEIDYITHDVVEQVVGTKAAFGVTLGDIMFNDLSLFESLNRSVAQIGLPWYNVIGNHDIDFLADVDKYSDETFERVYGPSYYSFNYGHVHFVVLDDIDWVVDKDKRYYRGGLGENQLRFIERDLEQVPPEKLIVFMMHIPLVDSTRWLEEDLKRLLDLMQKRPHCISLAGHTHHHEHRLLTAEDGWKGEKPHHLIINGTVCGSWWSGVPDENGIPHTIMSCGTPNGWGLMTFSGNKYSYRYFAARRPADYQAQITVPEEVAQGQSVVVHANIFNAWPNAQVRWRVRGGEWEAMEKQFKEDPAYLAILEWEASIEKHPWRKLSAPRKCPHLWVGTLPTDLKPGNHTIEVEATNPDGVVLRGIRQIRVTADPGQ